MKWMSSISSTSACRYFARNFGVAFFAIASINWFVNNSEVMNTMFISGFRRKSSWPTACIKWVLPKPRPPYRNSGL